MKINFRVVYVDVVNLNAIQWYVGRGFGLVPFQPAATALDVDEMADIPAAPDGALPVHDVMLDRGESRHDGRKGTPLAYCLQTGGAALWRRLSESAAVLGNLADDCVRYTVARGRRGVGPPPGTPRASL